MTLACTHCGKRLSRKTARQIDGVIMCSTCMFKPKASVDTHPQDGDALAAPLVSGAVTRDSVADTQIPSNSND